MGSLFLNFLVLSSLCRMPFMIGFIYVVVLRAYFGMCRFECF